MSSRYSIITAVLLSVAVLGLGALLLSGQRENTQGLFFDGTDSDSAVAADLFSPREGEARNLSDAAMGTTTEGWQTYRSDTYHFSLRHPSDLSVMQYDAGEGAASLVFENEDLSHGFQIFVTPYGEKVITRARFLMDQPSGALSEPVSATVDGAGGMLFYGKNDDIGDTIEVWFVRDGYLYEVYTYKVLEPYLKDIIRTWTFTQ